MAIKIKSVFKLSSTRYSTILNYSNCDNKLEYIYTEKMDLFLIVLSIIALSETTLADIKNKPGRGRGSMWW